MKGKNKLVPRLMGVTKESVLRVDVKTKEVSDFYSISNPPTFGVFLKTFNSCLGMPQQGPQLWLFEAHHAYVESGAITQSASM